MAFSVGPCPGNVDITHCQHGQLTSFPFGITRQLGTGYLGHSTGDTFTKPSVLARLPGSRAIGHNRYATTGGDGLRNVQPLFAEFEGGGFAVAHNGNLTNALTLQRNLQRKGAIFQSTSDTETILHLVATSHQVHLVDKLVTALQQVEGAYSLVAISEKKLIGCRDPRGVRPLVLGRLGAAYILASETCALDIIGADYERDVQPGEMVIITDDGLESRFPFETTPSKFCIFEYVYFSRPDSSIGAESVYAVRKNIGRELASEAPTDADIVVPVPDSGTTAAIGYAERAGLPFELGIIRNHYVGRTFIQPSDEIRHMGVKLKHNSNRQVLANKKVVLVDDSIVRGTTSKKIVQMVRDAGAAEVHMRIASPPTTHACFYGVDTPERANLLASYMSEDEIAEYIAVDSLKYLTIDGLYRAIGETKRNGDLPQYCDACFTGSYPTQLTDQAAGAKLRRLSVHSEGA